MKAIFFLGLLPFLSLACPAAELRIATMDLQRVLTGYVKAQDAAREIKSKEVSFLKELDDLRLEGRKLAGEVDQLRELSSDVALSAPERETKQRSFELKLTDLQSFGVRYDEFKGQREAEIRAQAARLNKSVLDDVMAVTRVVGEKDGFNLILNSSKGHPLASDVLFTRNVDDITDKILARLNASVPPARTFP